MATETPNLGLPYRLGASQLPDLNYNRALRTLDATTHIAVIDKDLTSPPVSPSEGDRYIVAASATGDWAGHDEEIAAWQDGAWRFYTPKEGWVAWVIDEGLNYMWTVVGGGGGGSVDAADVAFTPAGDVAATDVQAAIEELDAEKQPLASALTSLSSASANGVSLVTAANYAAMRALLDLEAGTDFYSIAAADAAIAAAIAAIPGKQAIWIPASAMIAQTTSPAAYGELELATNDIMLSYWAFDTNADEHVQFSFQAPKSWNESTITFRFVWSHPSTATNFGVSFWLQGLARSNDDAGDTAMGTAIEVEDTGGTTNDIYVSPESNAVTIGGTPAEDDMLFFRLFRDVSDSSDNLAVDARIHGVMIFLTTNANTDD